VKIIDFGSSRAAGFDEMSSAGVDATFAGTIDYTAPEHHRGERATNRADIYALGCIAYELLTGKLPYARGFANARDVQRLTYISARNLRDDVPGWMDAGLEQAVHKSPTERTDVLSAVVENLRQPNPALVRDRPMPLLQRNPVGFWRAIAVVMLIVNFLLVLRLFG
jgi:eukaryotic-like serine/threonine-protein kinase